MIIGSHVSISKGLIGAAQEAYSYGANTFMIYTGAPQNTIRKNIDQLKIEEGKEFIKNNNIKNFIVHAPYIINLASFKDELYKLGISFLKSEIERTTSLGSELIVLHPGSYTEKTVEFGIDRIANGLNLVLNEFTKPIICLETMSGKGSEIGKNFEELKQIIEKVNLKEKIGVCLDTCHLHDSGYDIINNFDNVLEEFDKIIGIDKIKVIHINGSLNERGKKKDRHANIGAEETNIKGKDYIGFDAIYKIVHNEKLKNIPFILETPWLDKKTNLYQKEIESLRG